MQSYTVPGEACLACYYSPGFALYASFAPSVGAEGVRARLHSHRPCQSLSEHWVLSSGIWRNQSLHSSELRSCNSAWSLCRPCKWGKTPCTHDSPLFTHIKVRQNVMLYVFKKRKGPLSALGHSCFIESDPLLSMERIPLTFQGIRSGPLKEKHVLVVFTPLTHLSSSRLLPIHKIHSHITSRAVKQLKN